MTALPDVPEYDTCGCGKWIIWTRPNNRFVALEAEPSLLGEPVNEFGTVTRHRVHSCPKLEKRTQLTQE
jgi:hypothetical protein